jgi:SAM-dependent methyltransferase
LYDRHAELWNSVRLPGVTIENEWLERFGGLLEPQARVLDVGCGNGQPIGAQLLHDGFDVWGVDRAPSLIETARANLPGGHWLVADMTSLDLGQTFGGIVAWHSLFHLTGPEQHRVFPLLAAHAQPGAVLLFTSGPAAGSTFGRFGGEVLAHHSLDPDEYEAVLAAEGFTVHEFRETDPNCGTATVWLASFSG